MIMSLPLREDIFSFVIVSPRYSLSSAGAIRYDDGVASYIAFSPEEQEKNGRPRGAISRLLYSFSLVLVRGFIISVRKSYRPRA